jgi:hypothetical protein
MSKDRIAFIFKRPKPEGEGTAPSKHQETLTHDKASHPVKWNTGVPPYLLIQYPQFQLSAVHRKPKKIGKLKK